MGVVFRRVLMIMGGLFLVVLLGVFLGYIFLVSPLHTSKSEYASPKDVRFVLNWCELGDGRIEKVIHSYKSHRSLTGDHNDAYAIKITHVELSELAKKDFSGAPHWYRGDQLPEVVNQAVSFAVVLNSSLKDYSWFPSEKDLRSKDFYVYSWKIEFHGLMTTSADLIFIHPADQMVYFFSGKT